MYPPHHHHHQHQHHQQHLYIQLKHTHPPLVLLSSSPHGGRGGGGGGGAGDPKPSESLLTKWSVRSKGNYSTTLHSSSEDTVAPAEPGILLQARKGKQN